MKSKSGELVSFRPNKVVVTNVVDALTAVAMSSHEVRIPSWLEGSTSNVPADEILACKNVLLHLPTQQTIQHTPLFFGGAALEFDYDPNAPDPLNWLEFLNQLWPEDSASIGTLQEWFGYCLSMDTRQQKMLLIVGPKRSGKGTIARVQRRLLGRENVCAPTLFSLTQNFGLAPLIGKRLGIISDARLDRRADQATIAERLLSISGEDAVTIDRKNREAWTGTLPTRFMILTNELPRIADASGAMASRFVVLQLTQSFLGFEDTELTDRLLEELPGILNWGMDGWISLQERGHFVQPKSADDTISELEDLASPVSAFIRDECQIGPELSVPRDALFLAWQGWCDAQGRQYPGTKATFGRDLRAAVATIKDKRRTIEKKVVRFYTGIGLKL